MKKVCIIGAGMTGLSAGYALARSGKFEVKIIEQEPHVGGLAISLKKKGVITDLGPHRINTELPEVEELLKELAGERLVTVPRKSRMYLAGRYVEYPIRPLELIAALGLIPPIRFFGSFFLHKFFARKSGDDSFEEYMIEAFGPALYEYLFRPYIQKTWKWNPADLSDEIARVRLAVGGLNKMLSGLLSPKKSSSGALKEFLYIKGGVNQLVELFRERAEDAGVEILTGHRLAGLHLSNSNVTELVVRGESAEDILSADVVISTIPLPVLLPLLLRTCQDAKAQEALDHLKYLSMILVCLIADRDRISDNSWLYFPGSDISINRAYESKNFDSGMAPKGKSVLCCEVTCVKGDRIWNMSEENIIGQVKGDVSRTGLIESGEIVDGFIHRIEWAYPIYYRTFRHDLREIWRYLGGVTNLVSVGRQGLYNHNNMDHAIGMGSAAASYLEQYPEPAPKWYAELDQFSGYRIVD